MFQSTPNTILSLEYIEVDILIRFSYSLTVTEIWSAYFSFRPLQTCKVVGTIIETNLSGVTHPITWFYTRFMTQLFSHLYVKFILFQEITVPSHSKQELIRYSAYTWSCANSTILRESLEGCWPGVFFPASPNRQDPKSWLDNWSSHYVINWVIGWLFGQFGTSLEDFRATLCQKIITYSCPVWSLPWV